MKELGILLIFIATGILMAIGITRFAGLSLPTSAAVASVVSLLVYLMLDLKPESNPGDSTLMRLTKGSWYRKR